VHYGIDIKVDILHLLNAGLTNKKHSVLSFAIFVVRNIKPAAAVPMSSPSCSFSSQRNVM